MIAPTTACEVDTGSFNMVMRATVSAEASDAINAVLSEKDVRLLIVYMPRWPSRSAPRMMKREERITALEEIYCL
jgi:hypothetical protein